MGTVWAGIERLAAGRTMLVFTHDPASLHRAARVVLVEAGKVAAGGTHDSLMASEPRYRDLVCGDPAR